MGSPDGAAPSPLYSSHAHHSDPRMAWDRTEDIKPPRGLLEPPELGWPGAPHPCCDKLAVERSPWVLRMAEAPASVPPPPRTLELTPAKPSQAQEPPSGMEGQVEERCLEQVQTMVVGEVLKDVDTACKLLNISPDPLDWSCVHVQKWLLWTEHLYRLPQVSTMFHQLSGRDLCSMTEADFRQRSSPFGDVLYAHLDIWSFSDEGALSTRGQQIRGGRGALVRRGVQLPQPAHPPVAVPAGAAAEAAQLQPLHPLAEQRERHFQNRGLCSRGSALGNQEEPPGHELRQTEPLHSPVLQERHHSEARRVPQAGVPVCQPSMTNNGTGGPRRRSQTYAGHTVQERPSL